MEFLNRLLVSEALSEIARIMREARSDRVRLEAAKFIVQTYMRSIESEAQAFDIHALERELGIGSDTRVS